MIISPLKRAILSWSAHYTYRGVTMQKNPIDLAIYSMLIWDMRPKTIIEIGSKDGGSAMWFADQLELFFGGGRVVSIDKQPPTLTYPDVYFMGADAKKIREIKIDYPCLVVEDSAHDYETTTAVLEFFDVRLRPGDYMVVEDLHVAAVKRAVNDWLIRRRRYMTDKRYQDFYGFSDHAYMKVV